MKKILAFLLTLSLAFVLLGCVKDVKPTSVEITGAKDMVVGDSLTLTAKLLRNLSFSKATPISTARPTSQALKQSLPN